MQNDTKAGREGRGVKKVPPKCHVLFVWPLSQLDHFLQLLIYIQKLSCLKLLNSVPGWNAKSRLTWDGSRTSSRPLQVRTNYSTHLLRTPEIFSNISGAIN